MKSEHAHPWNVPPKEAVELQRQLARFVVTRDDFGVIRTVAGVDVGFEDKGRVTRAAVAVLEYPSLQPAEEAVARLPTTFPYVPGLLSFRELPAVLRAVETLNRLPDIFLCDGQGIAHPRRFGIACHLGLLTNTPALGVGKSRLVGTHGEVPGQRGGWTALLDRDEVVGAVLRTRAGVKPVYISPGHRISLESAVKLIMACTTRYKLPETTRAAHRLASGS
ncbi:MAG: deoxyribonuclease V [Gammaproteobacteria bacterium]